MHDNVRRPAGGPSAVIAPEMRVSARSVPFRAYLGVRLGVTVCMALAYAVDWHVRSPSYAYASLWIGIAGFGLVGLVQLLAAWRFEEHLADTLLLTLAFDLASLGAMFYATDTLQDPAYPIVVGLVLLYASVMRRRSSWVIAALAAGVYSAAHLLAGTSGLAATSMLLFDAFALFGIGFAASMMVARQANRERLLLTNEIHEAEMNLQLQKRIAELHAISEITEIVHSSLDFDHVGSLVMDVLVRAIDLPSCSLFAIDRTKAETLFSASVGLTSLPQLPPLARRGDLTAALAVGREHFECRTLVEHNNMMIVFCAQTETLNDMTEDDRLVLQAVASELAVAIENSQLYKLTKRLAVTDELTGLRNYRFLQQRLDEEYERSRRYEKDVSFLMLDIDEFKKLNDLHGHICGDRVLAEFARVLRANVREVDVVARYGGEEFSIILPETDAAGAFVVAEKIREAVASTLFEDEAGRATVRITVSVGLATYPVHAGDRESLLREADEALYQAKRTGRNRVRTPHHDLSFDGDYGEAS